MPFAAAWMYLEIIILTEVRERWISYHLYVESKKKHTNEKHKLTYLQNTNRLTDTENKLVTKGERARRDKLGAFN